MSKNNSKCPRCNEKSNTMKKRFYSEKAAALLVKLGEVLEENIERPICQFCYLEIRDLLVDESLSVPFGEKPVIKPTKSVTPKSS